MIIHVFLHHSLTYPITFHTITYTAINITITIIML